MNEIFITAEDRVLVLAGEDRTLQVPGMIREIEVDVMSMIASRHHTVGDTRIWTINYEPWLDNAAVIETINVASNSTTCTASAGTISGPRVMFTLTGGVLNERLTVTLTMTDSFGNIKHDSIVFTVLAP
jgi:hypothetical protein